MSLDSSEWIEIGGEFETGDAEVIGSGVVATEGIVELVASAAGLALGLSEQVWGSWTSDFRILDASVSRLDCEDSETGVK